MAPRSAILRGGIAAFVAAFAAAAPAAAAIDVRHVQATALETTLISNHDGILAPGETFSLTERIKNHNLANTAHNVHGSLSFAGGNVVVEAIGDPLVTLTQTESNYGDIAPDTEADNLNLYRGQIASDAACGQTLDFNLHVTSTEGTQDVPFKAVTGVPGPLASADSVDVPKAIDDFSPVDSGVEIAGPGYVSKLAVRLGDLSHTATGDLKIELVAPDGASVILVDHRGASADDFSNTVFSDGAAQSIDTAAAPFTGTFRPEQSLANLAGHGAPGLWRLRVSDTGTGDTGTLNSWGLDVQRAICDGSPVASFSPNPNPVLPGNNVTLDASGSVDPNGSIVKYEWDFDNDGTVDYTSADASDNSVVHSFATRGRYPVKLTVTDDTDVTSFVTMDVSVTTPPVADIQASPTNPLSQTDVTLDASGSTDPDFPGSPLDRYEWDLDGDGSFETDTDNVANTSVNFDTPGSRTVRVRVTDVDGASSVASIGVDVQNRLPTAAFTAPDPAVVGTSASFDAAASTDADGTVDRYEWDLDGDGSYETDTGATATTSHTYSSAGDVTVTLRITDDFGGVTTLPQTLHVTTAPVAAFTATDNPTSLHKPVQFDGSTSVDPDGDPIAKYEWDLDGNGSYETDSGATATTTHTYNSNGTVTVKLRVTDAAGATGTTTVSVVASNHPPTANVVASPATATAGTPVLLDARGSTDDDGTLVKYDWDLDGNGTFETTSLSSPTLSHTYPNAGTFNVGVRVKDNDNGSASATALVTVRPESDAGGSTDDGAGGDGSGGDGSGGSDGSTADGFRAQLTGTPIQRLRVVIKHGLIVGCRASDKTTCALRAELRAVDARRLGLRARADKPIVLGTVRIVVSASGHVLGRLRLSARGRRALRRARRLSVVVRGTVIGPSGHATVSRSFLLRR